MAAEPPARLLDLTRLVSRLGRGPLTGVDRVERAYLVRLLAEPAPCFALVRTALGLLLLDRAGMRAVLDRADGVVAVGEANLLARLTRRQPRRARAEADLRRLAIARVPQSLMRGMLRRHLPEGTAYLNVGHANLSATLLGSIKRALGGRVAVLVHDTIPLDHPELTRPRTFGVFARKMQAVADAADLVIYTTRDARSRAEVHLAGFGRVPPAVVAGLGVDPVMADLAAMPPGLDPARPFFLAVGTIEPRKGHAFLLDLWEQMHAAPNVAGIPQLVIAGVRGWADPEVFRRLDTLPFVGTSVLECPDLSDGAIAALMDRAAALLFPTLAEGFGLPGVEAMGRGCPVVCASLPVFREVLGDYPVYLTAGDRYAWLETMNALTATGGQAEKVARIGREVPGWDSHFDTVLSLT